MKDWIWMRDLMILRVSISINLKNLPMIILTIINASDANSHILEVLDNVIKILISNNSNNQQQ